MPLPREKSAWRTTGVALAARVLGDEIWGGVVVNSWRTRKGLGGDKGHGPCIFKPRTDRLREEWGLGHSRGGKRGEEGELGHLSTGVWKESRGLETIYACAFGDMKGG